MVADINPGPGDSLYGFPPTVRRLFANANGTLFFAANDGTHGVELWKVPTWR